MKNITVDARMIHSSGIGTVIQNVLERLIPMCQQYHFYLLGDLNALSRYPFFSLPNVSGISCTAPIYSIKEQWELWRKIPKDTDLLWSPHYNIPIFYSGKLLVTVHDLFHLAMPQYVHGFHKKAYAKYMFHKVAQKAAAVICVSNFTKHELCKYTDISPEKLHVIYNGIDDFWFHPDLNAKPIYAKPYILYVGNVKPHKNLKNLILAFSLIKDEIPHDLLIVGKKEGFITGDSEVIRLAEQLGNRVQFTGFVSNETLRQYYHDADMFVFPSLYEGFGLPPLEAMVAGCSRILCSNISVIREICQDNVLYFDPLNIKDIAQKLVTVTKENVVNRIGLRLKKFSWDSSVNKMYEIMLINENSEDLM